MKRILLPFCCLFLFPVLTHASETRATAVLLDISKSVAPQEFQKAKAAIREMIDQNQPPDIVSVYVFGSQLKKVDPAELDAVAATESYTRLFDAAYDAMQDLAVAPANRKAILIFSDGYDTKSSTISEDVISYAKQEGIPVYSIGIGKSNQAVLERIAKLTGGAFFSTFEKELVGHIKGAMAKERQLAKPSPLRKEPAQETKSVLQPSSPQPVAPQVTPEERKTAIPYLWIAGILGAVLFLGLIVFAVSRRKHKARECPTCGKKLESYEMFCPDCEPRIAPTVKMHVRAQSAQEVTPSGGEESIPSEWLERSQNTQEILSRTFVLTETPMLVVTEGHNQGQSYTLKPDTPVTIGRSRVNEIRLDDEAVSAQHCRIIPENNAHVLLDLGSTNGTFINEAKVNKAILKDGDTIRVGQTNFLFQIHQYRQ